MTENNQPDEPEFLSRTSDDNKHVGFHHDNDHISVCIECAKGYDTDGWRSLHQDEANGFGDECTICRKPLYRTDDSEAGNNAETE